jgi:hypothetical protein
MLIRSALRCGVTASSGNRLPTFRDNVAVPSLWVAAAAAAAAATTRRCVTPQKRADVLVTVFKKDTGGYYLEPLQPLHVFTVCLCKVHFNIIFPSKFLYLHSPTKTNC